ncbi:unnamed protein product, partial [marine sediment metagenome]
DCGDPMKRSDAWYIAVRALRLHFLQGNSQIEGRDKWIDEQVVETLHQIRMTGASKDTTTMVDNS